MPAELLAWDSEFWGVRIGRVLGERLDRAAVAAVDDWAQREAVACLYFLGEDQRETVEAAGAGGFGLVEPRLTLTHSRNDPPMRYEAPGVAVREHRAEDVPALRELARRTRYVTRFAHDPRFPAERVVDYYEAWAVRSCEGFADAVLVAEAEGGIVGYITCRLAERGVDSRFGIVAVDEGHRRSGAAAALLCEGAAWLEARGMETVSVDVAARNVRTQRYVQRQGFFTSAFRLYFHKWF